MSVTVPGQAESPALSEKQQRILSYLRDRADEQTYFKSRLIGEELDMSPKEVGTNMTAIQEENLDIDVEKWGYSSSTTWMVTTS
jgi:biotin operon repressor